MMKIRAKALNKGELFCCTQKEIKKVFGDCDIAVDFAYPRRNYEGLNYVWNKFKGRIICFMCVFKAEEIDPESLHYRSRPFIDFYVLKESEFTNDLHKEFANNILSRMYKEYLFHKDDLKEKPYYLRIELIDNKFIMYEGIGAKKIINA